VTIALVVKAGRFKPIPIAAVQKFEGSITEFIEIEGNIEIIRESSNGVGCAAEVSFASAKMEKWKSTKVEKY
jgi:hypothetical protein